MKNWITPGVILLLLMPSFFLLSIWNELPQSVPLHFGRDGKPDRFGSRNSLWYLIAFLSFVSAFLFLLLQNVHRIDPKRGASANRGRMRKIGFALTLFLTFIQLWILQVTRQPEPLFSSRAVFIAVGLLFTVTGNYMYNLKPNYFAGLRLPWTLESEKNWRSTHHLAGRLWFAGGLLLAACSFLLPHKTTLILMLAFTFFGVVIPMAHSYRLFRKDNGLISE